MENLNYAKLFTWGAGKVSLFLTVLGPSLFKDVKISESIFEKCFSMNESKLRFYYFPTSQRLWLAVGSIYVMTQCAFNE